jgi:hypothetical protein
MKTNSMNEYGKFLEAKKMNVLRLIPVVMGLVLMIALVI